MGRFLEAWGSRGSGLRNSWGSLTRTFYSAPTTPSLRDSRIDYEAVRALYYNTNNAMKHGSVFARGIVDGCADFISYPRLTVQDEDIDQVLNDCVQDYWKYSLLSMYRISMRDTSCWVRIRKPLPGPLTSAEDESRLHLEIVTADRVEPYYNPLTNELDRLEVLNEVWIEDADFDIATRNTSGKIHKILEVLYADHFDYYDLTEQQPIELNVRNEWGFIPFVEAVNEFDPTLNGGVSDIESAYVFMRAFDDVMSQTRTAHKTHATPKVKFKIDDVMTFINNNYPTSIVNGEFTGKVNWEGNEILFLESTEDAGFLEAKSSVVGDSVTLLNFLIDCIAISSRTPKWVMMKFTGQEVSAKSTSEDLPFENRIGAKRSSFTEAIQMLAKMALVVYGENPLTPSLTWPELQVEDFAAHAQALSSLVTATEVANRAGAISLETYRAKIRPHYPEMKTNAQEQTAVDKEQKAAADAQLQNEIALIKAKAKATPAPKPAPTPQLIPGQNGDRVPMTVAPENS